MKKITKIFITAAVISTMNLTALAAEIPGESVPPHVTVNQVAITEKLISPILCEVENGLGYCSSVRLSYCNYPRPFRNGLMFLHRCPRGLKQLMYELRRPQYHSMKKQQLLQ